MSQQDVTPYRTRYGDMTADKAAQDLLDRAQFRLSFLEGILSISHNGGEGLTLPGYDVCGLASILEDVAHDVSEARLYYYGESIGEKWCPEPGRVDS